MHYIILLKTFYDNKLQTITSTEVQLEKKNDNVE